MKERIRLTDGGAALVSDSAAEHLRKMSELMGGESAFVLSRTPRGTSFSARGCIGEIEFSDGDSIRISPDIRTPGLRAEPERMLIEMMHRIFGIKAGGCSCEGLFEFFVRLFLDSVNKLVVRGMRAKYHLVSGNEKAFKGRIMFSEHIRQNYIHKERIFVEYEIYSQNRAENRLIKKTLETVLRKTRDARNIKGAKTLLMTMEEIESSTDTAKDFGLCVTDRNMVDYAAPLLWCDVFLNGMGLASDGRGALSYAVLVSTDNLFSAYVGRASTSARYDGSYSVKYKAGIAADGGIGGTSVVRIDLDWSFYSKRSGVRTTDAERLFLSAPGYRAIPSASDGDRLRSMAGSYLSDAIARC